MLFILELIHMVAYVKQVALMLADVGISYLCKSITLFCNYMDNVHMHVSNILSALVFDDCCIILEL